MTEPTKIKIMFPADPGTIHLIAPSRLPDFMSAAGMELGPEDVSTEFSARSSTYQETGDSFWDDPRYRHLRPYNVVRGEDGTGVLFLPVYGDLTPDFPYQAGTYATGYEYIEACARRGASDPSVKAIFMPVNSGGGIARGVDECAKTIAEVAKTKPVIAYASGIMASAAYWLGSQASKVYVAPTSEGVGSIGTTTGRWDRSGVIEKEGAKYHAFKTGTKKTFGNPYLPLTEAEIAETQSRIEAINDVFLSSVSAARSISVEDVRKMEAGLFSAKEAVRIGLADAVATRAQVMTAVFGEPQNRAGTGSNEGSEMTDKTNDKTKAEQSTPAVTADTVQAPVAAAGPDATNEAVAAAVARVESILGCDEAKGREAQASIFAFKTNLGLDEVKQLLAAAPVAAPVTTPAPAKSHFEAAMEQTPNPGVGAGVAPGEEQDPMMTAILANFK